MSCGCKKREPVVITPQPTPVPLPLPEEPKQEDNG